MRFANVETPTFEGAAGDGLGSIGSPEVAERMNLYDREGNVVAYFDKSVAGVTSLSVGGVAGVTDSSTSTLTNKTITDPAGSGFMITKLVAFTENATNTIHTGTVTLPAGAWLHNIEITNSVLWTGGTATMKVGDSVDDDGYFAGIDLKATDLVLGEVLSAADSTNWGGKNGAYLVAATGRRGPAATNFGSYFAAGSDIIGVVTVGTPATTAGRTWMSVTYSVGAVVAAVATGP
jgi:hypothetical protein